ncbi:MAG: tRNA (guanine(10)-N(2))-dimethyltransferase [Candidatus Micrarchaeia archaeon]
MEEEGIKFSVSKDVFFNPAMRLCRSMASLAVGAIEGDLEITDAFCASGIRGIRYAKENGNVMKLTSLDIEKKAITLAKKNAKANKIISKAVVGNISRAAFDLDADFLEIDPFGTPAPYLVDSFRFFNTKKTAYLSVTATDVAVLCGGRTAACMKNYHSKPMNNEFTHETGMRIMLKRIAEVAAEFNMGIEPLLSLSDKHYLKSVIRLKRSADHADDSMKKLGHVYYCRKCGFRGDGKFPKPCARCGIETDYAGPIWLGELHDAGFLDKMSALNRSRSYSDQVQIGKMLSLMAGEIGLPPYYYNVHSICQMHGLKSVPSMDDLLSALRSGGARAVRTHFSPISLKTDAPLERLLEVISWKK